VESIKISAFWVAALRSLVKVYRCLRDSCCSHQEDVKAARELAVEDIAAP
jgi:hypothetical protein